MKVYTIINKACTKKSRNNRKLLSKVGIKFWQTHKKNIQGFPKNKKPINRKSTPINLKCNPLQIYKNGIDQNEKLPGHQVVTCQRLKFKFMIFL
jgi:hypothetical protein